MKMKFKTVFIFATMLMMVLSACSNNSGSNTASNGDDSGGKTNEEDKYGGVLKIGALTTLQNLGLASELRAVDDFFISEPALEKLGRFDEDGSMQPLLAEQWEEDPENAKITFKLRSGIKFHDGTDLNAEAVKWNIEEFMESGRSEFSDIESVEMPDEYTVEVNLKEWNSSMLEAICNFLPISSPTAYKENGREWAMENPVGTGPFKFVSWTKNKSVKYEKFDDYWQEGKPYLDGIEFHLYADSTTATASMQAREIDGFIQGPSLLAKDLEEVPDITILTNETGLGSQMKGFLFNSLDKDSPFHNPLVRQAASLSVDRQAIVDTFIYGYGIVSNQWGAPGSKSYNEALDIDYNPEKAKELLKEAGYPNGFETTFTLRNDPGEVEIGTAIAGYLSEIGIKAELNVIDSGLWQKITHASGEQFKDLIFLTGRSDPDLAMYMPRNFSSKGVIYSHGLDIPKEIDEMYPKLKASTDDKTKTELSHELQQLVYEKYALAVPVYVSAQPVPIYNYVHDSGINKAHGSEWTPEDTWLKK
ncbi:ABC transporter substrate-binding protein [Siminovitchia sp. 179-K 8D1 HS]|uniref:ABC transporter substrate-binding protein n=1 Tax=Siminovitchia sp. 179-K 8D1 HS TaxID=3142385 RepID=UPI0039A17CE6